MAVCDLDAHRVEDGKKLINDFYAKKTGAPYDGVTGYANYHELLANKDIDAVVVSTPDHWHALIVALTLSAPARMSTSKSRSSLTIAEGRALSNAVQLQAASADRQQQRSTVQFATLPNWCAMRGVIGDLQRV